MKHRNGYVSCYGHLSRYARGLRVGQRVAQKQLLGFVGATGLATGPHLDFRLAQNGRYHRPAAHAHRRGRAGAAARALALREGQGDARLSELRAAQPAIVLDAAM